MHLDDDRLQRLLDGELPAGETPEVRAHLTTCVACRERAATAERALAELDDLLRLLDHPATPPTVADVARAARPRWAGPARWAAAAAFAVALAGVAYAVPASPLPRWIAVVAERLERRDGTRMPDPVPPPAREAGIAVPPGERLVVAFDSNQAEGEAMVMLRPGAGEVTIRGPGGAASFATGPDHVTVMNFGSRASYTVEIPADAPSIEIRVAGVRKLLKTGPRIALAAGADSATAGYRIPLGP